MVNSNNVVSFHHKMGMIRCLEDDEIERQLKCKICYVGLCIFVCFNKYHTKERFSYMTRGGGRGGACIYIKHITTKKVMYIEFYSI
jgi:hypothetical protein